MNSSNPPGATSLSGLTDQNDIVGTIIIPEFTVNFLFMIVTKQLNSYDGRVIIEYKDESGNWQTWKNLTPISNMEIFNFMIDGSGGINTFTIDGTEPQYPLKFRVSVAIQASGGSCTVKGSYL